MRNISLHTKQFLEYRDIEEIEAKALELLETLGMKISNSEAIRKLSCFDGIKIQAGRVCLASDLVKEKVNEYKKDGKSIEFWSKIENVDTDHVMRLSDAGDEFSYRPTFIMCSHASYILDPDTEEIRPLTTEDVVQMTKFMDSLSSFTPIRAAAPGNPQDLPPLLQPVARYKISCQYSHYGGFVSPCESIDSAEYIYEMTQVMERPFIASMYVISPLRMEGNDFDKILHFLDRKVPIAVSTWPMLGVTAPITLPEGVIQALAEVLGAYVILKLLSGERLVGFKVRLRAFDMREASLVYGTPEDCLLESIVSEVNRFYGNAHVCNMNTMAKDAGIQSGVERFSTALLGVLFGARIIADIGQLSTDEVFSPEQAVYDCEIIDHTMKLVEGFEFGKGDINLIKEVIASEDKFYYLSSEATKKNFRTTYWLPRIFTRAMLQQYLARHEDARKYVKDLVKQKIQEHNFELDYDKNRELERIYKKAKEKLST